MRSTLVFAHLHLMIALVRWLGLTDPDSTFHVMYHKFVYPHSPDPSMLQQSGCTTCKIILSPHTQLARQVQTQK